MIQLETLVGMRVLWENEDIIWKVKSTDTGTLRAIERWIHRFLDKRRKA